MSSFYAIEEDVKSNEILKPVSEGNDLGSSEKRFHNVVVAISAGNSGVSCGEYRQEDVDANNLIIHLTNFTGSIKLKKVPPPSRFTSSFSTKIDEKIPNPLPEPSWLTSELIEETSSTKRKGEYDQLLAAKKPNIVTPAPAKGVLLYDSSSSSSDTRNSSSLEEQFSDAFWRASHVVWELPDGQGVALHGGIRTVDRIFGDLFFLKYDTAAAFDSGNRVINMNVSRCLCEPQPRYGHTATRYMESMVAVFGGIGVSDGIHGHTDSLLVLDTTLDLWYPPAVSGKPPSPRCMHSAGVLLSGRAIVIYGGQDKHGKFPHNIHWLDTTRWHWNSPKCEGKPPLARAGHCCHAIDERSLIIFGGHDSTRGETFGDVHLLRCVERRKGVYSWEWEQPEIASLSGKDCSAPCPCPCPRSAFASCVVTRSGEKYLFIRGGFTHKERRSGDDDMITENDDDERPVTCIPEPGFPAKPCSDSYLLDLTNFTWHLVDPALVESVTLDVNNASPGADPSGASNFSAVQGKVGEKAVVVTSPIDDNKQRVFLCGGSAVSGNCPAISSISVEALLQSIGENAI